MNVCSYNKRNNTPLAFYHQIYSTRNETVTLGLMSFQVEESWFLE